MTNPTDEDNEHFQTVSPQSYLGFCPRLNTGKVTEIVV